MKKLFVAVALLCSAQAVQALDVWDDTKVYANKAIFWKSESLMSLSFQSVFPKPIYEKSYFGLMITGGAIVGAGAFTYFTAGAGAPVAAAGVSSVASWVAGGGAGSYMAGLSTIGGWFGGNAMLGSAILNGISIGVAGGGATFASLPALGKAGVMASITATALDGVMLVKNPETKNLSYRIRLTVPKELGSREVRLLTKRLDEVEAKSLKEDARKEIKTYRDLEKKTKELLEEAKSKGQAALRKGGSNEDMMVLAILANNTGNFDLFEKLVNKISVAKIENTGYIDYLKAVARIKRGDIQTATNLLQNSGWTRIEGQVGRNGFDGLFVKYEDGVIKDVLIAESKYNTGCLQLTNFGVQMSEEWIHRKMVELKARFPNEEIYVKLAPFIEAGAYRTVLWNLKIEEDALKIGISKVRSKGGTVAIDCAEGSEHPFTNSIKLKAPRNKFEKQVLGWYNEELAAIGRLSSRSWESLH